MFDLHTLQIFTAGGSNSDLAIPGLKDDIAQRIKEFIINKTDIENESIEEDTIEKKVLTIEESSPTTLAKKVEEENGQFDEPKHDF